MNELENSLNNMSIEDTEDTEETYYIEHTDTSFITEDKLETFKEFYEGLVYFNDCEVMNRLKYYMDIVLLSDYYNCHIRYKKRYDLLIQIYSLIIGTNSMVNYELLYEVKSEYIYKLIYKFLQNFFIFYLEINYINILDVYYEDMSIDIFIISLNKSDNLRCLKGFVNKWALKDVD